MTADQIEELKRRIDLNEGAITEPMVRNAELARLLEEREKLLEALRVADACPGLCSNHGVEEAIAFAEEAAP